MDRREESRAEQNDLSRDRASQPAHAPGEDPEGNAPQVAGGVVGAGAGLAMGMAAGPIGMVIGSLAGAVGGWWATDKITEGTGTYSDEEDRWYRGHYDQPSFRLADRAYEDVRPAYAYGHIAALNPAYRGRSFEDVEPELERDWTLGLAAAHADWATARRYARIGFERGTERAGGAAPARS